MMMLFPGAVGIVAEDAVGVGYHVWQGGRLLSYRAATNGTRAARPPTF
jgi:hypothetical protein